MNTQRSFPPLPQGWFAVAFSHELPPGGVLSRRYFGQDLVLFRTRSGIPAVMDAYCTHLGAHLGQGGAVEGEMIRCPFHYFCFDTSGTCVSTPYASKIPPKATIKTWPVQERQGMLLIYHAVDGASPAWTVPSLDMTGWSPLFSRTYTLRGHPQETTENSVDLGHLYVVHGYQEVEMLRELATDGPHLSVSYAMQREAPFMRPRRLMRAEFEIHAYGLGYSFVDAQVPSYGLHTRHFVSATPIDGERIALRAAMSIKDLPRNPALRLPLAMLPRERARKLLGSAIFRGFLHDLEQDILIWEHKRYMPRPALAQGDGPIGRYRRWASQFYPSPAEREEYRQPDLTTTA